MRKTEQGSHQIEILKLNGFHLTSTVLVNPSHSGEENRRDGALPGEVPHSPREHSLKHVSFPLIWKEECRGPILNFSILTYL